MTPAQSPRGRTPGGPHDSSGGTQRVLHSVPTPASEDTETSPLARWHLERERRDAAIAVIREQLQQQPSPNMVRSCARRWTTYILQLAEDIATARNSTETTE